MNRILTAIVLAAPQPGDYDPSTGKGSEWGKAAPIGLLVILLLGIATFFLLRSFTRQLKKVPASFDPDPVEAAGAPGPAGTADSSATGGPGVADATAGAPYAAPGGRADEAGVVRVPAAADDSTAPHRPGIDDQAG